MKQLAIILFCITFALFGCKKTNNLEAVDSINQIDNEWNDLPYKLNVVYFVPNDVDTVPEYKRRISEILLQLQEFYAANLEREGFGRKSFGLDLLSSDRVNILLVQGNEGKVSYPYDGGGSKVNTELSTYFSQHPEQKKSEHTLIIMPSTSGDPLNPGGVPFYGLGRNCFALDYPTMDISYLGQTDVQGNLATKWIGGLAHELGHGLNASHNKERKSEQSILGTALMGAGNGTYGRNPTFITHASAATFVNSQTFSTVTRSDWYGTVNHLITKLVGKVENGKVIISGAFNADKAVTDINFWHDPYPAGGNQDYDAPSWSVKPIGVDSFYVECPLVDFYKLEGGYQLRIRFYHENGTAKTYSYEYSFENGVPQIEVINTKDLLNRASWTVVGTDSQEDTGAAINVLDGDQSTTWHTQWKTAEPGHPHYLTLDMGSVTAVKGFAFANRDNLNGAIKDFELFSSNDNASWVSLGTFSLARVMNWQYIDLATIQSFRYVKLVTQNSHGDFNYAHLAEFAAYSN